MYRYIIIFLLTFIVVCGFAQDIEVKKFETLEIDHTAATNYRNDNNGNPCALLIVNSLKEGLEFEGWIIGDVERRKESYYVYVANGAKHIKIKHADFQTKDVVFNDYAVSALKGGTTYVLQLADDTKDIINKVYRLGWNLNKMEVPSSAKIFLNMAATRGDVKAQIAMAQLSLTGKVSVGKFLNENKGLYWINKLLAKGDSTCLDSMPGELMYTYACQLIWNGIRYDGWNTDTLKNKSVYTKASEFEIKACLKGFKDAGNELFEDYPKGNGLPKYVKEIIRCCEDSVKKGNEKAMECLGLIYEKGIGTEANLTLAADWFYSLYETNHSSTNLCRVYGNPQYPIDEEKLIFLQKQAKEGCHEALYQLGLMYEEGRYFPLDYEKAMDLYCQKAKLHKGIQYRKAILYCKRKEFDKALKEAEKLMHEVHEPGVDLMNLRCLRDILSIYRVESGYSFFRDMRNSPNECIKELSDLAKLGHKDAQEFLEQINKQKK